MAHGSREDAARDFGGGWAVRGRSAVFVGVLGADEDS
jgi:hypothetical protein